MIYYLCCDKDKTLNLFMEKPKRGTSFWVGKERIVAVKKLTKNNPVILLVGPLS